MRKLTITLLTLAVFLSGCANRFVDYDNFRGYPHKAMAVGVNSYGEPSGGYAFAGGRTLEEAEKNAMTNCKMYSGKYDCILERSNNTNVFYNNSYQYKKNFQEKLNFERQRQTEDRLRNYIASIRQACISYGFTDDNAIAGCVQTEINNEILRQQQAQAYANAQARSNAARRNQALSNMGRCLSTEGNFSACSNAWNGYNPPKTTVCEFDAFGNKITSTCRTQ